MTSAALLASVQRSTKFHTNHFIQILRARLRRVSCWRSRPTCASRNALDTASRAEMPHLPKPRPLFAATFSVRKIPFFSSSLSFGFEDGFRYSLVRSKWTGEESFILDPLEVKIRGVIVFGTRNWGSGNCDAGIGSLCPFQSSKAAN